MSNCSPNLSAWMKRPTSFIAPDKRWKGDGERESS